MIARVMLMLVGVVLLPICVAASQTLYALLRAVQPASLDTVPPAAWALVGGFVLWLFLYATAPRPVRSYVLAHELTHALWGWLMGARVKNLKVAEDKGSVTLTKSNFLITLAPYFFPLYTVLVIIAYYGLSLFFDLSGYFPFWLGAVGFTWGFHFTFTISILLQRQTDIQECGRLFSYTAIYLLNILGVCVWIVFVSRVTLEQMLVSLGAHTAALGAWIAGAAETIWAKTRQ